MGRGQKHELAPRPILHQKGDHRLEQSVFDQVPHVELVQRANTCSEEPNACQHNGFGGVIQREQAQHLLHHVVLQDEVANPVRVVRDTKRKQLADENHCRRSDGRLELSLLLQELRVPG